MIIERYGRVGPFTGAVAVAIPASVLMCSNLPFANLPPRNVRSYKRRRLESAFTGGPRPETDEAQARLVRQRRSLGHALAIPIHVVELALGELVALRRRKPIPVQRLGEVARLADPDAFLVEHAHHPLGVGVALGGGQPAPVGGVVEVHGHAQAGDEGGALIVRAAQDILGLGVAKVGGLEVVRERRLRISGPGGIVAGADRGGGGARRGGAR